MQMSTTEQRASTELGKQSCKKETWERVPRSEKLLRGSDSLLQKQTPMFLQNIDPVSRIEGAKGLSLDQRRRKQEEGWF